MPRSRLWKLAVIGTVAGAFSALFGVGGGIVMVPALVLWLGYGEREATGTSLAAIGVIAVLAVVAHGAYGNIRLREGIVLGLLSPLGVLAGTVVANAVSGRVLELSFAALLLVVAAQMVRRGLAAEPEGSGTSR